MLKYTTNILLKDHLEKPVNDQINMTKMLVVL